MLTQQGTITVLIADDHEVTRKGIRTFLEQAPDIEVVGEAEDGDQIKHMAASLRPRILLLDLIMPNLSPEELEKWVRTNYPETITLVLTSHDRDAYLSSMLDAGDKHGCALTTGGGVQCWGNNTDGQLGNGTTTLSDIPVNISGLGSGVAKIATGDRHTCAVTTSGGAKCWGNNAFGALGDNSTTDRTTAVDVSGLTSGVAAIATGSEHTCALTLLFSICS